jgi:hypothetical protein
MPFRLTCKVEKTSKIIKKISTYFWPSTWNITSSPPLNSPRKICLNFHSLPCKSLAINSWAGGCWEKSCRSKLWRVEKLIDLVNIKLCSMNFWQVFYQWRKHFLSCAARHGESSMSACVTSSQSLAEVVCWLFTRSAQLCWKVSLFLLLLQIQSMLKAEEWIYLFKLQNQQLLKAVCHTAFRGCKVICAYTSSVSTSAWIQNKKLDKENKIRFRRKNKKNELKGNTCY